MNLPKGKHQGGQTQAGYSQRFNGNSMNQRSASQSRPEAWATSFTHQGGAGPALRSLPPGPPNNLPPQHHTGSIGGLGPGGGAGPQGGGGGGGGGGGPAQAPTPPGASSHDMAKQGGGLPTQSSHMTGQGHMPGASGMAITFNMSNQPRPSGPQPYSYRPSNSARLVSGRGPVMTQNGVGHMSYQHMPFSQGLQMVASPLSSQAVFTPMLPWYTASPQQRQPSYIHPATQQQMIFQPPIYQYPGSPQGPQSQLLFNPILRTNAAGANTGGGGHGGTLPQQQALQQQSPVSLQPQAVVGAGGQVSGLPVGTGGGGPPPNVAMVSGMAPPGVSVGGVVTVPGGVGGPSATQQPQSKPRKNAIPILDPDTGHDVVEKMLADEASQGAASGSSSCAESSTQDENMKRKKEFAAQIYKVAKTSSESVTTPQLSQPSDSSGETNPQASGAVNGPSENLYSIPSENVGPNQLGMNVASEPWKQVPDKEIMEPSTCDSIIQKIVEPVTKSESIREEKDLDSAHIATPSVPEAPQPPVVSARGGGVQVPVTPTVISGVPMTTVPIVTPSPLVQVCDDQNLASNVSISPSKEPVPVTPMKHPEPSAQKTLTALTQKSTPNCSNHTQKGGESSVTRKMSSVSREASSERKTPVEASPNEEDKKDEKQVEQAAVPTEEPLPQRVQHQANGEDSLDSKATQRGKQKKVQKNRELNRKGAEKEGTDMDAFSDAQLQQQRQDAAATSAISEAPINSQRIEPLVPPSQPGEDKVVNEVKSRTETPPPLSHIPSPKASVIPPVTSERSAVNTENPQVNVSSNYSVKSELHPLPSSEPGIDNKNWDNKMSSVESSSSEQNSLEKATEKGTEVEKEVAVEKVTEENSLEQWKPENTNQVNEDSLIVEKDMPTLEKVDKQDEIVAVKNSENKMVSSIEMKKTEDDSSFKTNLTQDADVGTEGSTPVIENVASELAALTLKNKNFYKEDQWSPMNPTGKKKYERDFLLHLKSDPQSMKKPDNLPDLEIVLNRQYRPVDMKSIGNMSRSSQQDFAPLFVKPSSRLPAKRNSQQGKPKVQRVMLVSLSLNEDVKLHVSENAWKPRTKAKEGPKKDEEELYAAMRGILNKLTPQNFEKLVAQVMNLPIDTMDKLKGVIDLVFDKAVDEPNFSVAYAELCNYLNNQNIARQARKNSEESSNDFRKILLKRCQCEFEKDKATGRGLSEKQKEIDKETSEERKKELRLQMEEDERRMRRKSVGVIRFIGELFKLGMINHSIMVTCITDLFEAGDEESLECLCKLLTTVGKVLEETLEKKGGKDQNLNGFFVKMKAIVAKRKTSSRVRFMLQDVIDLKNSRWVPRRDESNPKKIDQIAMEAERETEMQKLASLYPPNPPRSSMGGGMGRKEDRGKPRGNDMWQTVPPSKNAKITVDSGKLKAGVDTEIGNLGPNNNMFKWGMGASGGSAGLRPDKKQNTFQILNDMDSPGSDKRMPRYKDSSGSYTKSSSASFINMPEERSRLAPVSRKNMPVPQSSLDSLRLRTGPSPNAPSRDSSVVPDDISRSSSMSSSTVDTLQSKPPMDPDLLQRVCQNTIDEYKSEQKLEEVLESLKTDIPPVNYLEFLCISLDRVLETSSQIRQSYGRLVIYLIKNEVISKQLFIDSLQRTLSVADETIIDVPKFWEYVAEILAVLFEEGTLELSALRELTSQLQENNLSGPLVLECLKVLFKDKGPAWICEKWKASSLQWSDLMAADKVAEFVNNPELVYVTGGSGTILPPKSPSISMEEVKRKLNEILRSKNWDNDQVFAWIKGNVGEAVNQPQFIRALTTAVFESAIEKDSKLKVNTLGDSSRLIQKYITTNEQNELQCLYAIQALVNRLEHPKGLIFSIFEHLMNLDLITAASFKAWEESPNEPDGKAVALKSLSPFFIYLNESEDIDSNED